MRKTAWGIAVATLLFALGWRIWSELLPRPLPLQSHQRVPTSRVSSVRTQSASIPQDHFLHSETVTQASHVPASGFWQRLFGTESDPRPQSVACTRSRLSLRPLLDRRDWPTLRATFEEALSDPECAAEWGSASAITTSISGWLSRVENFKQARTYLTKQTELFDSLSDAVAAPERIRLGQFRMERLLETVSGYHWWQAHDLDGGSSARVGILSANVQAGQIVRIPVAAGPGGSWIDMTRVIPFYAQAASWEARLVDLREEYGERLPADIADQAARIRELNAALLPEIKRELESARGQLQDAIPQLTNAIEHEARLIEDDELRLVVMVENFIAGLPTERVSTPSDANAGPPTP